MKDNRYYCIKPVKNGCYIVCKAQFMLFGKPFFYTPCVHNIRGTAFIFRSFELAKAAAEKHRKGYFDKFIKSKKEKPVYFKL